MNQSVAGIVRAAISASAGLLLAWGGQGLYAAPVQWTAASGGNGHWYEFVYAPEGFTWQQAWAAASAASHLGLPGYLATVTSQAENNFLYALAKYPAGATGTVFDPANPSVSLGTVDISGRDASTWLGGSDAATEGTWRWVNGPETGTIFWIGTVAGSAPGGAFAWWNNPATPGGSAGNEPNASVAGEDYLHLRYAGGQWNDNASSALLTLPGFNPDGITRTRGPAAYIVEYSAATSPLTFTVTNLNESGAGSLRDAIGQANLAPGPNTVDFAPGLTGTITLTSGGIPINEALTIVGPGADKITIDGNANGRIFAVFATDPACPALDGPDYLVTISGLRLTNAHRNADSSGGAIYTEHSLALHAMILDNNQARSGAGISVNTQYPGQSLTITNSQFNNNIAKPLTVVTATEIRGGAIAVVERCSNTSTTPVTITIANSVFQGNRVQPTTLESKGGAILVYSDADITISDSRFVGNGVDIAVPPVAGAVYGGGAIYGRAKSLRIERSEIAGNDADIGGALRFFNDIATLQTPATAMSVKIVDSTISGNVASTTAGALFAYGNIAVELDNTTISDNTAAATRTGGILFNSGATTPVTGSNAIAGTLKLVSSILANSKVGATDLSTNVAVIPTFTVDATKSLIETICPSPNCEITVSGTGNLTGVDPVLGPLAFNGGPTRTHALLAGSPALNAGSNPLGLTTDQRGIGFPRVSGAAADMGAYESVVAAAPLLQTVVSRKTHGAAGVFNLALSEVPTAPTTEPRLGPAQTLVFAFDKPVTGGSAAVTEGTATVGTVSASGSELVVPLTAVSNYQYVTVAVSNVSASDGGTGGVGTVRVGFLPGDVNQSRVVTLSDLGQVNAQIAQAVTAANYLKDINASGTLSLADKGLTNQQLTKALPAP